MPTPAQVFERMIEVIQAGRCAWVSWPFFKENVEEMRQLFQECQRTLEAEERRSGPQVREAPRPRHRLLLIHESDRFIEVPPEKSSSSEE